MGSTGITRFLVVFPDFEGVVEFVLKHVSGKDVDCVNHMICFDPDTFYFKLQFSLFWTYIDAAFIQILFSTYSLLLADP